MSTRIDPDLYAQALADIRSIPSASTIPAPASEPATTITGCCAGDRTGYQRHLRTGTPPCDASRAANTAYGRGPKEPRKLGIDCGTYSGYQHHRRLREPACDGCLAAKRDYYNAYYAKRADRIRQQRQARRQQAGGAA
jgi:hypothetical protein